MAKLTKAKHKQDCIDLIIEEFKRVGCEFTCLASFNLVRDYARFLARKAAVEHGFVYSNSIYFPQVNSGDNLLFWAARQYCKQWLLEQETV